jgi:integrase
MVRKRGNRWHYDLMIHRVRYRGCIPEAQNKWQAEKAEAKIRLEIYEGKFGGESGSTRMVDFIDQTYLPWARSTKLSCRDDELNCKVLSDFFGGKAFNQISPLLIEKFKRERRDSMTRYGEQRKPASVNRELATLSRMFSLAMDNGLVASNPCTKVHKLREDNQRTRYLSAEEEERLMASLTGRRAHLVPLVRLAIHTGMRRGELLGLRWRNVDFLRGAIHVTKTKTNRDRDVPLNSEAREILLGLQRESEGEEFVFSNKKTGLNLTDVKKGFSSACREAGIQDFKFHDLRHTAGTRLADTGADAFTIAEVLGHATLQMTKRYTHATDKRKRAAVEALSGYAQRNLSQDCHKTRTGNLAIALSD